MHRTKWSHKEYMLRAEFKLPSITDEEAALERKAPICVRTIILQRGLADRSAAMMKECLKLLKDEWLMRSCNGGPLEILKFLDVETYESIGGVGHGGPLGGWTGKVAWCSKYQAILISSQH